MKTTQCKENYMKFDVFVQEVFYKTIEISSNDVSKVISMVGLDIEKGLVSNFDNTKNQNIRIVPASVPPANDYVPDSRITGEDGSVQQLER